MEARELGVGGSYTASQMQTAVPALGSAGNLRRRALTVYKMRGYRT